MKAKSSSRLLTTAFVAVTAAGCAGTPSMGDKINQFGQATSQIGNGWNDGEGMVKKGMKLRSEAESLAEKSKTKLQESEQLIEEGNRKMRENEVAFQEQFGTTLR